jgi:hypothetical protein
VGVAPGTVGTSSCSSEEFERFRTVGSFTRRLSDEQELVPTASTAQIRRGVDFTFEAAGWARRDCRPTWRANMRILLPLLKAADRC